MRQPSSRPFTLGDLMALIAAVAAGIAFQRWVESSPGTLSHVFGAFGVAGYFRVPRWFDFPWSRTPVYQALAVTTALGLLRWRPPRPRFRQICREPGAMACLAVVVATGVGLLAEWIQAALRATGSFAIPLFWQHEATRSLIINAAASSVAGVWIALALQRRWSPKQSWLDRAGRLLGLYWLAGALLGQLFWPILEVP